MRTWPTLVGRRFNSLTVVEQGVGHVTTGGSHQRTWLCRCDCGNEVTVKSGELSSGGTRSCGCARRKYPLMADFLREHEGVPGCWVYPSKRDKDGYAFYKDGEDSKCRAHQEAFRLANGDLPPGLHACHSCDNPPCARPDHLFPGTAKQNQDDAKSKDRHSRGERNGFSKLIESQVRAIRSDTRTQMVIAAEYGIRQTTVSEIKRGNLWAHVS